MARQYVKPAYSDPINSVDLFDYDRKNEFGTMYCVAAAILPEEVNLYWTSYLKTDQVIKVCKAVWYSYKEPSLLLRGELVRKGNHLIMAPASDSEVLDAVMTHMHNRSPRTVWIDFDDLELEITTED